MEDKQNQFIIREYSELWKGYGVELPPLSVSVSASSTDLVFVEEGPASRQSKALLGKILEAMKLEPGSYRILEISAELGAQIQSESASIVVALGERAAQALSGLESESLRIVATLSPEYLLKNPAAKKIVWEDMKRVLAYLGAAK